MKSDWDLLCGFYVYKTLLDTLLARVRQAMDMNKRSLRLHAHGVKLRNLKPDLMELKA